MDALTSGGDMPAEAIREFAHILGTEEVWLARLEYRSPSLAVWPALSSSDLEGAVRQTHKRWKLYLDRIQQSEVLDSVTYTNSAGLRFDNQIGDILIHVALHGCVSCCRAASRAAAGSLFGDLSTEEETVGTAGDRCPLT